MGRAGVGAAWPGPQGRYSPAGNWETGNLGFWVGGQVYSFPETQNSSSPGCRLAVMAGLPARVLLRDSSVGHF